MPFLAPSEDPTVAARRALASFGYPKVALSAKRRTGSGGWAFEMGRARLTLDAQGKPRGWRSGLPYEVASRRVFEPKVAGLLRRFRLPLPPGRWETREGMRYWFEPSLRGHPALGLSMMEAQVSRDGRRVILWLYHPSALPKAPLPPKPLPRGQALAALERPIRAEIGGQANVSVRRTRGSCGWAGTGGARPGSCTRGSSGSSTTPAWDRGGWGAGWRSTRGRARS